MQKQIDNYKLSPKNELILQDQIHQFDELEKNILDTRQVFAKYIEHGSEMCQNVNKLVKNFEACILSDKSLSPIISILNKFTTVMTEHYKLVQETIIDQIDKFTNSEIKKAENDSKTAKKENAAYSKLMDLYAAFPIKKRVSNATDFNELEAKLIAQNWIAIKSNFSFSRSLGLIERKRVLEMTSCFIRFANHLGQSFHQYAQIYDQSKDSFTIIQQALPSTSSELSHYNDQTSRYEITLQKVFYLYFKSFNKSTVYSPSSELTNEGFLWLRDTKWKRWEKRYYILKYGMLSEFKDALIPTHSYKLLVSTVKSVDDAERPFCFSVISPDQKLLFQSLTSYDRDRWISIIQANIEWLLTNSGTNRSRSNSSSNSNPDSMLSESERIMLGRNKTVIMRISTTPLNTRCADCGARTPTWVCINWGTVICIQCSGVHRFMTTSVSKVRSTTLDRIDDTTMELFKIIGNKNANEILEELLDEKQVTKIEADSKKEERQQFIMQKYKNLAFVKKIEIDIEKAIRSNDILAVYRSICTGQIHEMKNALHLAAACGNQLVCRLIALNMSNPNIEIDGWNALSYAAYYGQIKNAQILLSSGCATETSKPEGNPYRIAMLKKDEEMSAVFFPYWNKVPVTGVLGQPPQKFA